MDSSQGEATSNERSTLVFIFEDKKQSTAEANVDLRTPAQKSNDYYAEKARKEFEQLLEARKSQKEGRWADPKLRKLLVEEMRCDRITRNHFYKWIISNNDEDGDNLFDEIYAEKNEYCVHDSGYFMYKKWSDECHMGMKYVDCIVLKEISNTGYLPLYANCDIEVRSNFQVRFYQDDKYIASRELVFK